MKTSYLFLLSLFLLFSPFPFPFSPSSFLRQQAPIGHLASLILVSVSTSLYLSTSLLLYLYLSIYSVTIQSTRSSPCLPLSVCTCLLLIYFSSSSSPLPLVPSSPLPSYSLLSFIFSFTLARYSAFEEKMLPHAREENPTLKLSQIKELIWKQWQKSPENPINQLA